MPTNDLPAETPLLKRLNEQRIAAAHTRKEILERVAEGEDLSGEDEQSYERANKNIDRLGKLIQEEIKRIQEDEDLSAAFAAGVRRQSARAGKEQREESTVDENSIGAMMRRDLKASRGGETRNGGVYQQLPESRDLMASTANKGAEFIPTTLVDSLFEKIFDDSAILQANPTILRTQSGEPMKLPRLTALNNLPAGGAFPQASSRVVEGGPILEAEPNFDQLQLDAYKYAQYTQLSRELVEDGVLDIEALLGRILGRNIANYIGFDLTLGTGTSQPRGVRTVIQVANKVDTAGGGLWATADYDKFFDVVAKLKPGYRRNGKWLVNDTSMFTLRKLKMGSVYAWEPNLQGAGQPDTFLGYPILTDPNIPVPASNAGVTAIFGDFSAYYVRFVRDVRIEWSMEFAWVNDLLSVKAVMRADGDAIDDAAFAGMNSVT